MNIFDYLIGYIALIVWLFILIKNTNTSKWIIYPHALFSLGILILYVIPGIYWSLREWTYGIPSYESGMPKVFLIATVFSLPLLTYRIFSLSTPFQFSPVNNEFCSKLRFSQLSTILFLMLSLSGFAWKIYLFSLGHQSRFERLDPTVLGSAELGYLVGNIGFYYRTFYFLVLLTGNRKYQKLARYAWCFDGCMQIFSLHRYSLIMFLFHSSVFLALRGFVFTIRRFVVLGLGLLFTLTIVGYASVTAYDYAQNDRNFLKPTEVFAALWSSFMSYSEGNFSSTLTNSSSDSSVVRMVDDTMFRLHEGRSAAAVVPNFPSPYEFLYGESIYQVFYAFIPRYFWPEKPDLRDTHVITVDFMPGDVGVNPLGTLAEIYINGGYILVFFVGLFCVLVIHYLTSKITTLNQIKRISICALYPLIAEILISANRNFNQRLSEGLRIALVYMIIYQILLYSFRDFRDKDPYNTNEGNH